MCVRAYNLLRPPPPPLNENPGSAPAFFSDLQQKKFWQNVHNGIGVFIIIVHDWPLNSQAKKQKKIRNCPPSCFPLINDLFCIFNFLYMYVQIFRTSYFARFVFSLFPPSLPLPTFSPYLSCSQSRCGTILAATASWRAPSQAPQATCSRPKRATFAPDRSRRQTWNSSETLARLPYSTSFRWPCKR